MVWAEAGLAVVELQQRNLLEPPKDTMLTQLDRFNKIGTVVMPAFIQKVTLLMATVEHRIKEFEFLKQKFLAAGVSLVITGAPMLKPV